MSVFQILEGISENILKEDILKQFCTVVSKPIERPQTMPHKTVYPNSEERRNDSSPPKPEDLTPESTRMDESTKDVIYESPKKDSPDNIVGKKRKLEYSDDESEISLKKARIGE